jgi:peptidyl-prolyl cis-trans isomerase A (cyclophilin A)
MTRSTYRLAPVAALFVLSLFLPGCSQPETDASSSGSAPAASSTGSPQDSAVNAPAASSETTSTGSETAEDSMGKGPVKVVVETTKGNIELELYPDKAPITVKNFVSYANKKHYDGTIFHRVIPGFMIQGGGFTADLKEKPTDPPIKNEAGNGLKNDRGTIAMARTGVVDSATSQFFINVENNNQGLDHKDDTPRGFGYCVFGKVTKGMDVADKIVNSPTGVKDGPHGPMDDVPVETITIKSVKVLK